MNIAFFEIEDWEKPLIKKQLAGHTIQFFSDALSKKHISKLKNTQVISVFIYSQLPKELLDKLPKLKLITTRSTGFDHIDLETCKENKIQVRNVPSYGENTVAEHTFALILNLSRKIHKAWDRTRHLDFSQTGLRGFDLQGKTLGVIGAGRIGQHVIRIAKGFEMKVIATEHHPNKKLEQQLGFTRVTLPTLLKKSDIITLHCPYLPSTHHLINSKNIKGCKSTAMIVNTARGGLIDTHALLQALQTKRIAGAALDVFEEECFISEERELHSPHFAKSCDLKTILENHLLAKRDDVILTPHNAFNSTEALTRIIHTTIQNIKAFNSKRSINRIV